MALIKLGANAITALPAGVGGKVLQIVQGIKTDTMTSTTMNTFLASGLSASITPSATSSKILVLGTISIAHNQDTNSVAFRLKEMVIKIEQEYQVQLKHQIKILQ